MELLYLVDRLVTRILQSIYGFLYNKWQISLRMQAFISSITAIILGTFIAVILDISSSDNTYFYLVSYLCFLIIGRIVSKRALSKLLYWLHLFFDPQYALSTDKPYSSGYVAWGYVLGAVLFFSFYSFSPIPDLESSFYYVFLILLSDDAYVAFVERKKNNTDKRRQPMTEAFEQFLEQCGWLKKPLPQNL